MKKFLCLTIVCAIICSCFAAVYAAETEKIPAAFIYVATDGDDTANGTENAPFATLEHAVRAAREIPGAVVINIKGGEYPLGNTIELTAADNNLVIRANPGEEVVITGGTKIKFEDFAPVKDEELLSKVITGSARSKIISADLSSVENLGEIAVCGYGITCNFAPTLTYNDMYLTIAQYPNGKEYLYTGDIIDDGSKNERGDAGHTIKFRVRDDRWKKWSGSSDVWAIGWYTHDWADTTTPAEIDYETGVVTTTAYHDVKTDRRVKFFNLFEEIDAPGEYYIDREAKKLYMIAPEGFKAGDYLTFSAHDKDIMTLSGCENITVQGIRFEGTTKRGIYGTACKSCVVDACEFTAIGDTVVTFEEDSRDCIVKNCYIHDIGSHGVIVSGGDKETLTPGNNVIENCHIERFMRYKLTYTGAANMHGVGNRISHCEINDAPHQAVIYSGLYNIFEYNNIYRVCTDSADSGAIYTGRDWTYRDNEIRYNYFHDMEMIETTTGMEMQAVYLDDMHSCTYVHHNVFYKVDSVALFGGGRDNSFTNNMMLECAKPFTVDARGTDWMATGEGSAIHNNLIASPWQTELWKEKFPEITEIPDNHPEYPMNNTIKTNLIYNTPEPELHSLVAEYGDVESPMEVTTKEFIDYGKNFSLKEDSSVFEKMPEFENIPFDEIGTYEYTVEDKWIDNGAVSENSDEIKVLLNGEKIDFADVPPQIINDRTMVPLRAIFEALGAEVVWDDATKTVTAVKDDVTIRMTIGADSFTRNGEKIALDSPATIVDSRTLVPVRAIAESFGSEVGWIGETKTVTITD